jgi:hypothetical protein
VNGTELAVLAVRLRLDAVGAQAVLSMPFASGIGSCLVLGNPSLVPYVYLPSGLSSARPSRSSRAQSLPEGLCIRAFESQPHGGHLQHGRREADERKSGGHPGGSSDFFYPAGRMLEQGGSRPRSYGTFRTTISSSGMSPKSLAFDVSNRKCISAAASAPRSTAIHRLVSISQPTDRRAPPHAPADLSVGKR